MELTWSDMHVRHLDAPLSRPAAEPRPPGRDRRARLRGGRGLRDAHALRLSRPGGGRDLQRVAGRRAARRCTPCTRRSRESARGRRGARRSRSRSPTTATRAGGGARGRAALHDRAARSRSGVLVVHLGVPRRAAGRGRRQQPRRGDAAASRRSARLAEPLGVRLALEVIPNELSTAGVAGDAASKSELERADARHLPGLSATRT